MVTSPAPGLRRPKNVADQPTLSTSCMPCLLVCPKRWTSATAQTTSRHFPRRWDRACSYTHNTCAPFSLKSDASHHTVGDCFAVISPEPFDGKPGTECAGITRCGVLAAFLAAPDTVSACRDSASSQSKPACIRYSTASLIDMFTARRSAPIAASRTSRTLRRSGHPRAGGPPRGGDRGSCSNLRRSRSRTAHSAACSGVGPCAHCSRRRRSRAAQASMSASVGSSPACNVEGSCAISNSI